MSIFSSAQQSFYHKTYRRKGYNGQGHQWAKRFRSCQVYWALFSVVAVSYKFPIREKQFISAIRECTYEGSASPRFFQMQMFQVSNPSTLQVFRILYIRWRGFSLVAVIFCFFVVFSSLPISFLFRLSKKFNF